MSVSDSDILSKLQSLQPMPQYKAPDTSGLDAKIASEEQQATDAEKALEQADLGKSQVADTAAQSIPQEQQQLDQLMKQYPAKQVAYGAAMHAASVIGILAALGGKAAGLSGTAMMGALNGMMTGLNEGAEDKYNESLAKWKEELSNLKERHQHQMEMYNLMLTAYSGRADAAQKARDFALAMTKDSIEQKQYAITDSIDIFRARASAITNAEKVQSVFDKIALDKAKQDNEKLTSNAIDLAATELLKTGKMPSLGFGGAQARVQVLNRAGEMAAQVGGPQEAIAQQSIYRATQDELKKITVQQGPIQAYESTAIKQMDMVLAQSAKVDRSSIPLINKAILAGETKIQGDPEATRLLNAVMTASTEYAKVMSGGTGSAAASSDAARKEAQTIMNAMMTKEQLEGVVAQEKQSMRNRIAAFEETKAQLEQFLATSGTRGGAPPRGEDTGPKEGDKATSKSGRPIVFKNGQWEYAGG